MTYKYLYMYIMKNTRIKLMKYKFHRLLASPHVLFCKSTLRDYGSNIVKTCIACTCKVLFISLCSIKYCYGKCGLY